MNPFSLLPNWAPWSAAVGALAVAGVMYVGMSRADRNAANERAQWAEEKAQIERKSAEDMRQAIEDHNATAKRLEAAHADALAYRATSEAHAASAATAGAAAARAERRLLDVAATAALAASAAASQAGASGKCDAVAATANLLAGVLERIDSAASEIGEAAVGISGFADKAVGQLYECIARYRAVN